MPTRLGIWNECLGILGRMPLVSDTGTDDVSRVMLDWWSRVPDLVLEEQDWNSAIERVALVRKEETPPHGYTYYYSLPSGYKRIVMLNETGTEDEPFEAWKQEGDSIATDAEALYLWFIARTTIASPSRWSQALADYIGATMAWKSSPRLAPGKEDHAADVMRRARRIAMSLDARNDRPRRQPPGRFRRARLGGGTRNWEQGR